jgi:hypothetical protein
VDLMEKFILARIAKPQTVDKIMDKMWKTLKGFLRALTLHKLERGGLYDTLRYSLFAC